MQASTFLPQYSVPQSVETALKQHLGLDVDTKNPTKDFDLFVPMRGGGMCGVVTPVFLKSQLGSWKHQPPLHSLRHTTKHAHPATQHTSRPKHCSHSFTAHLDYTTWHKSMLRLHTQHAQTTQQHSMRVLTEQNIVLWGEATYPKQERDLTGHVIRLKLQLHNRPCMLLNKLCNAHSFGNIARSPGFPRSVYNKAFHTCFWSTCFWPVRQ